MASESRVTWATSVPILVFLGLSVLDLGPMYVTDRQTSHHRLMPPPHGDGGIINMASDEVVYNISLLAGLCTQIIDRLHE